MNQRIIIMNKLP